MGRGRKELYEYFAELVSIDSESLAERRMADALKSELEEMGFEVTEDNAGSMYGGTAGNIYGILRGTDPSRKPVLFSAHMDTVVPGKGKRAMLDQETGIITSGGDTVLGSDDVSGIVEIIEGISIAMEDPEGYGDIEVLFTIAEEVYGKGAKAFDYSMIRSECAFTADLAGSAGIAAVAAPSIISFEFEIRGKSAHAGFDPEAGINAIAAAAEIISGTRQGTISDGLTLNIGTITGGSASNIVSDSVRCTGEIRGFAHEEAMKTAAELEDRVRDICRRRGAGSDFRSEVMIKAYRVDEDSEPCRIFREACRRLDLEGRFTMTRIGSDNNIFSEHGIPGIVISSGMCNIHTTEEYMHIDDLEEGSRLVAELIKLR